MFLDFVKIVSEIVYIDQIVFPVLEIPMLHNFVIPTVFAVQKWFCRSPVQRRAEKIFGTLLTATQTTRRDEGRFFIG